MDFLLVGIVLWLLVVGSVVLFLWGLYKKSWKALLISGIAFIIPAYSFIGTDGWVRLLALVPVVAFILAFNFYKKK